MKDLVNFYFTEGANITAPDTNAIFTDNGVSVTVSVGYGLFIGNILNITGGSNITFIATSVTNSGNPAVTLTDGELIAVNRINYNRHHLILYNYQFYQALTSGFNININIEKIVGGGTLVHVMSSSIGALVVTSNTMSGGTVIHLSLFLCWNRN